MSFDIVLPEPLKELIGRIERGAITNFYGAPGTGKTNMCLLASVDCVKKGGSVIYIDTEGGFSVERLKQISDDYRDILKSIKIISPKTFREQARAIKSAGSLNHDLLIVDSLASLYRLECANPEMETLEANRELSVQLSMLSNIAREKNSAVIITSHVYKKWDTNEYRIIGGYTIKYWSKSIIFLEHTGRMGERKASIVKHRSLPEGKSVKFMIVDKGIKPSGFKIL